MRAVPAGAIPPVLLSLAAAAGCTCERPGGGAGRDPAPAAEASPPAGDDAAPAAAAPPEPDTWFRVEADLGELGRVPFLLGVHSREDRGYIDNGDEDLPVRVVGRDPLVVRIPVRGIELRLEETEEPGSLRGAWLGRYFFKREFPLTARRIESHGPEDLFPGDAPPAADLSGTWRVEIEEFGVGRGELRQDARGVLGGSIIPPEVGDMRFLMGRVIGAELRMAVFDGIHGWLLEATIAPDGTRFEGRWLISGIGSFRMSGSRVGAPPTDQLVSARMKPGTTRLSLPELSRPPFAGKPVIVDYFGTWCPGCMDLTPELVALRERHASAGLEVLSIALEPEGDRAEAERRIAEFREEFGVTWDIDLRMTDEYQEHIPPEIENASGFPLTIWVRRDGTVAAVHTGFVSKAVPAEHEALVRAFESWTEEIVRSPPP
ncbi:MAG TPA: TlpA disulfide reductase family protein [Kofleriaceae bacterium]|nr:TlpA disulfide reductase family protein [Kofleriaceae bacterium]